MSFSKISSSRPRREENPSSNENIYSNSQLQSNSRSIGSITNEDNTTGYISTNALSTPELQNSQGENFSKVRLAAQRERKISHDHENASSTFDSDFMSANNQESINETEEVDQIYDHPYTSCTYKTNDRLDSHGETSGQESGYREHHQQQQHSYAPQQRDIQSSARVIPQINFINVTTDCSSTDQESKSSSNQKKHNHVERIESIKKRGISQNRNFQNSSNLSGSESIASLDIENYSIQGERHTNPNTHETYETNETNSISSFGLPHSQHIETISNISNTNTSNSIPVNEIAFVSKKNTERTNLLQQKQYSNTSPSNINNNNATTRSANLISALSETAHQVHLQNTTRKKRYSCSRNHSRKSVKNNNSMSTSEKPTIVARYNDIEESDDEFASLDDNMSLSINYRDTINYFGNSNHTDSTQEEKDRESKEIQEWFCERSNSFEMGLNNSKLNAYGGKQNSHSQSQVHTNDTSIPPSPNPSSVSTTNLTNHSSTPNTSSKFQQKQRNILNLKNQQRMHSPKIRQGQKSSHSSHSSLSNLASPSSSRAETQHIPNIEAIDKDNKHEQDKVDNTIEKYLKNNGTKSATFQSPVITRKQPLRKKLTPYFVSQTGLPRDKSIKNKSTALIHQLSLAQSSSEENLLDTMDQYFEDVGIELNEAGRLTSNDNDYTSNLVGNDSENKSKDRSKDRSKVNRVPSSAYMKTMTGEQKSALKRSVQIKRENSRKKASINIKPINFSNLSNQIHMTSSISKTYSLDSSAMPSNFDLTSSTHTPNIDNNINREINDDDDGEEKKTEKNVKAKLKSVKVPGQMKSDTNTGDQETMTAVDTIDHVILNRSDSLERNFLDENLPEHNSFYPGISKKGHFGSTKSQSNTNSNSYSNTENGSYQNIYDAVFTTNKSRNIINTKQALKDSLQSNSQTIHALPASKIRVRSTSAYDTEAYTLQKNQKDLEKQRLKALAEKYHTREKNKLQRQKSREWDLSGDDVEGYSFNLDWKDETDNSPVDQLDHQIMHVSYTADSNPHNFKASISTRSQSVDYYKPNNRADTNSTLPTIMHQQLPKPRKLQKYDKFTELSHFPKATIIDTPEGMTEINDLEEEDQLKLRPYLLTDLLKIFLDNNIDINHLPSTDKLKFSKQNKDYARERRKDRLRTKNLTGGDKRMKTKGSLASSIVGVKSQVNYFHDNPTRSPFCTNLKSALLNDRRNLNDPNRKVPIILESLITLLEEHILEQGLYRVPGANSRIFKLQKVFTETWLAESKNWVSSFHYLSVWKSLEDYGVEVRPHDLCGLIKRYLRELDEPLVTKLYSGLFLTVDKIPSLKQKIKALNLCFLLLNKDNQYVLTFILKHLHKIASHSSVNKMNLSNLSVCIGGCFFDNYCSNQGQGTNSSNSSSTNSNNTPSYADIEFARSANNVCKLLIKYYEILKFLPGSVLSQTRKLNEIQFEQLRLKQKEKKSSPKFGKKFNLTDREQGDKDEERGHQIPTKTHNQKTLISRKKSASVDQGHLNFEVAFDPKWNLDEKPAPQSSVSFFSRTLFTGKYIKKSRADSQIEAKNKTNSSDYGYAGYGSNFRNARIMSSNDRDSTYSSNHNYGSNNSNGFISQQHQLELTKENILRINIDQSVNYKIFTDYNNHSINALNGNNSNVILGGQTAICLPNCSDKSNITVIQVVEYCVNKLNRSNYIGNHGSSRNGSHDNLLRTKSESSNMSEALSSVGSYGVGR